MLKQLQNICRAGWLSFARSETGVSAIEFVMVAPIIFFGLGMTLETGLMEFTQYSLQYAVENAGRSVRTGTAQMSAMTAANFKTLICNSFGTLVNCSSVTVYVRSDPDFATMVQKLPPLIQIGPATDPGTISQPACFNPGNPSQPAIIVATYDWYFVALGMSTGFGNVAGNTARRLTGLSIFKNQAFPGSSSGVCP